MWRSMRGHFQHIYFIMGFDKVIPVCQTFFLRFWNGLNKVLPEITQFIVLLSLNFHLWRLKSFCIQFGLFLSFQGRSKLFLKWQQWKWTFRSRKSTRLRRGCRGERSRGGRRTSNAPSCSPRTRPSKRRRGPFGLWAEIFPASGPGKNCPRASCTLPTCPGGSRNQRCEASSLSLARLRTSSWSGASGWVFICLVIPFLFFFLPSFALLFHFLFSSFAFFRCHVHHKASSRNFPLVPGEEKNS